VSATTQTPKFDVAAADPRLAALLATARRQAMTVRSNHVADTLLRLVSYVESLQADVEHKRGHMLDQTRRIQEAHDLLSRRLA
jgi:hypothetical protein